MDNIIDEIIKKQKAKLIEAQNLPENEIVYLKKDFLGWRVVEPPTKWYQWIFGSKRNMFYLLIIIAIAVMLYLGVQELISNYKLIAETPCNYCKAYIVDNMKINMPIIP